MNLERILEDANIDKAYERARDIFRKYRIDEKDFVDVYGEDAVKQDLSKLQKRKEKFDNAGKTAKRAEAFEAIIFHKADLNEWLGPEAHTVLVSEFDDVINGVDCVAEFVDDEGADHLALAVDVTFSTDPSVLEEKIKRVENDIRNGKLAELKYFQSENSEPQKLTRIPQVVIGADVSTVDELVELWLANDNRALENHFIKDLILEEVRLQLDRFRDYAQHLEHMELVHVYNKIIHRIEQAIDYAGGTDRDSVRAEDRTFSALENILT